ncbi:MAG TPA: biotin carboxylase N-terminal domain-containing protein, partial [Myxococcota bacterium]
MSAIHCVAIANRGEAALRCLRTLKALRARDGTGPLALALYTDPDRRAPFVRHADRALELPAPDGARGGVPGRGHGRVPGRGRRLLV